MKKENYIMRNLIDIIFYMEIYNIAETLKDFRLFSFRSVPIDIAYINKGVKLNIFSKKYLKDKQKRENFLFSKYGSFLEDMETIKDLDFYNDINNKKL